jgi:hypothetical protein
VTRLVARGFTCARKVWKMIELLIFVAIVWVCVETVFAISEEEW